MKRPPFFSVIIPTYNRAERVQAAIESVLAQTFHDYELIVVDDGSTDDTPLRLSQGYAKTGLKYIYQRNKGKPGARNTGIKFAWGEYIAFLDSDDRWKPEKLEKQASFIGKHRNVGLLYGPVERIDASGNLLVKETEEARKLCRRQHRRSEAYEVLAYQCTIFGSNLVVKRTVLEELNGYDENIKHYEDVDLYLRLALRYPFCYLDEALAQYSRYCGNTEGGDHCRGVVKVAEKHIEAIQNGHFYPAHERVALCFLQLRICRSQYILGNYQTVRTAFWKAMRLHPIASLEARTILHVLISYLPAGLLGCIRNHRGPMRKESYTVKQNR